MTSTRRDQRLPIYAIMAGILLWGLILAVGVGLRHWDARKAIVIGICVAGFLGTWAVLLFRRRDRSDHDNPQS